MSMKSFQKVMEQIIFMKAEAWIITRLYILCIIDVFPLHAIIGRSPTWLSHGSRLLLPARPAGSRSDTVHRSRHILVSVILRAG